MKPEQNDRSSTLRGQRIILFGGTSGVGFATAEAAAREGASVVVVSSRKEKVHNAILRLPKVRKDMWLIYLARSRFKHFSAKLVN